MAVSGHQIRLLREERGYTLQDLANKAELSLSYLSEIERDTKRPSLRTIEKLAAALNVPKFRLLGEGTVRENSLGIGVKIRLFRLDRGLSLNELASGCGISASYLSDIERGSVHPSLATLKLISKELGVPTLSLMSYEGSLGHKLKTLREEYGMTQAQLAQAAGVTAGLIGQIEQGKVQPSLKTLEKLSQVMGVTPCHFIMEAGAVDQMLSMMNPELRELLMHPNVQAILNLACNLNRKELQFVLRFIQLYKQSAHE